MKAAVFPQQCKRQKEDFKFLFSLENLFVAFVLCILLEYLKQGHVIPPLHEGGFLLSANNSVPSETVKSNATHLSC